MALILKHQTEDQFLVRLRERYRAAEGEQLIDTAAFTLAALQRGDITDAALRTRFGRTVAQWTTLKNRMQALINARVTVRTAIGE